VRRNEEERIRKEDRGKKGRGTRRVAGRLVMRWMAVL